LNNNLNYKIRNPENDIEFSEYFKLRWKILRKPLGKSIESIKDEFENDSFHLIAIMPDKRIIGVGRLHYAGQNSCQIRYMAVDDKFRGNGIGQSILLELIKEGLKNNVENIFLHAREEALEFYGKNKFKIVKKSHLLFNKIQHYYMEFIF
tara:strand:+ start:517 stop:966 length:450 start_codon:yes stop_codon:yes gene_type:complete